MAPHGKCKPESAVDGTGRRNAPTAALLAACFTCLADVAAVAAAQGVHRTLGQTPAWAFIGRNDATVHYEDQVDTVDSINACDLPERAKVTVLDGIGHNNVEQPILGLSGLGQGVPEYDLYDQSIYDWLLQHSRQ